MTYLFKPKRFLNYFAFYYPSSKKGWMITLFLFAFGALIFWQIDMHSHSGSDTLLAFSPWFISIAMMFDLLCFRFGKYPSWWEKRK